MAVAVTGQPRERNRAGLLVVPLTIVLLLLFVGSQVVFLRQAFFHSLGFGQVDYSHDTIGNVTGIFTDAFNRGVLLRTLWFSGVVVGACLVIGYPLSYVIARSSRVGGALLVIVIASAFSGTITNVLGWEVILGYTGPINSILVNIGILSHPVKLVDNMTGAIIGTVQVMLPFMVLILVPAIQGVDPNLEQAAAGLGASWWRIWARITWPMTTPGVVAGSLLVFATTAGTFTTPALLGGGTTQIIPIVIDQEIGVTLNYPVAAAFALVLLVVVLGLTYATVLATRRTVVA